jgi:hypothetical protein
MPPRGPVWIVVGPGEPYLNRIGPKTVWVSQLSTNMIYRSKTSMRRRFEGADGAVLICLTNVIEQKYFSLFSCF